MKPSGEEDSGSPDWSLDRATVSVGRQLLASKLGADRAPDTKERYGHGIDSEMPKTRLVVLNSPLEEEEH